MMHVADAHLGEVFAIQRTFDAIVVFTPGKAIPHGFYPGVDGCCGPVGIAAIGHDTAQMLELFVLVLNACFKPVLAVEIHDDAALVETVMAFGKIGSHGETEELLFGCHLENRGIVVPEMVIGALPEVGLWPGDYFDGVFGDEAALWFARPLKMVDIEFHGLVVIVIKGCLSAGFSGFQLCCMLFSDAAHGVGGHLMGCDEQGAFMIGHNLDFNLIVAPFFFDALAYQIGIG